MAIKHIIRSINTLDPSTFQFSTTPNDTFIYDPLVHIDYFSFGVPSDGWLVRPGSYIHEYFGDALAVFEYDEADFVRTDTKGDVVSTIKLVYAASSNESDSVILSYVDFENLSSQDAFYWGQNLGDGDIFGPYIIDQNLFTPWVKYIYPADHDRMLALLTEEAAASTWGLEIGDRDEIRHLIVTSEFAFMWALSIPEEQAAMKPRVTDPVWITVWNNTFPDDQIV